VNVVPAAASVTASADLYARSVETVVACWAEYARAMPEATVARHDGVSCAVFPREPERAVYNNAILDRGLSPSRRELAIRSMERTYAERGVARFAAWVHESDMTMQRDLTRRGYGVSEITRAMGIELAGASIAEPHLSLVEIPWDEYLAAFDLPPGLLRSLDRSRFRLLVAQEGGESVATTLGYDHDGDCGIYNVATVPHARRRGFASALTAVQLRDARARGCTTATLQATATAEGMYARIGFRDLGRIFEYTRVSDGAGEGSTCG
jgi:ribosomal protein S18 acetylase RimI-like enzyme